MKREAGDRPGEELPARVTLLTDFGTRDGYVAAMKGVIASRVAGVLIDDVAHDLGQGDVGGASRALGRYWRLYPPGTVHVVVVDPGVGTDRRALAASAAGRLFVAPDNGVLTRVLSEARDWRVREIRAVEAPGPAVSQTFHGRDVFAPAAAHLAGGGELDAVGPTVDDPVTLAEPAPRLTASHEDSAADHGLGPDAEYATGEIVHVDRFGNLVTNLPAGWVVDGDRVSIGGRTVAIRDCYADAASGELLAVVNSDGLVEIAVRDGSAADALCEGVGSRVTLLRMP